jgi:hypothetical protein
MQPFVYFILNIFIGVQALISVVCSQIRVVWWSC